MAISAGQLNQRITIERATTAPDGDTGDQVRTWANWKTRLPAKVEAVTGGSIVRARQVAETTEILFTIRWLAGVLVTDRVVYESERYGIVRVGDPYGDRRELRIEAKKAD